MAARKGTRPPAAGKGRVAGIPNKITRDVKEMILGALSGVGGQKYLEEQAIANPNAFMVLVGKVLPLQVSGEGGGPMILKLIKFGDVDAG
jgi:hypothetical protein